MLGMHNQSKNVLHAHEPTPDNDKGPKDVLAFELYE